MMTDPVGFLGDVNGGADFAFAALHGSISEATHSMTPRVSSVSRRPAAPFLVMWP